jgi:hypothetical protein
MSQRDEEILQACRESMEVVRRSEKVIGNVQLPTKKKIYKTVLINPEHNIFCKDISEEQYNAIKACKGVKVKIAELLLKEYNISFEHALCFGAKHEFLKDIGEYIPRRITGTNNKFNLTYSFHCYAMDEKEAQVQRGHILHQDEGSACNCLMHTLNPDYYLVYKVPEGI